jgi:type I restriction enzyme, S subunit
VSDLPPSWEPANLGEVAHWSSGGTPKSNVSEFYGGDIPWVVTGDLTDGLVHATTQTLTALGLAKSSAKLVPPGTVLVAMYGASIGRLGIASVPLATNQAIANAQVHAQAAYPKYVFYYLLDQRSALAAAGKGAAQPNIGQGVLKDWPIPVAPLPEQERIVTAIEEQLSRLDAGAAALERVRLNLKRMRAAVLQDAVTGQLTSPDRARSPNEQPPRWVLMTPDELASATRTP